MADAAADPDSEPAKKNGGILVPVLIGVILSLIMGGGGFFVAFSGMIGGAEPEPEMAKTETKPPEGPLSASGVDPNAVAFVPIDPIVVTLAAPGATRHLRFEAQLEVVPGEVEAVTRLMPRVLDVMNGYLRAIRLEDIEKPTALLTVRAHMLRRVQLVVGYARVSDLLVTEFVLN